VEENNLSREELLKENSRLNSVLKHYSNKYRELETAVRKLKIARAESEGIYDAEINLYGLLEET